MTYSANLKGYSIPWSLRAHGLWCHTSLRHLSPFRARKRDWIVLWPTHLCGCVPGRINSLLTTFQSVLLLYFFPPSLFFSKHLSDFHTGRSLPSSPGLASSSAPLRWWTWKVSPRRWEAALIAGTRSAPSDAAPAVMTSTLCVSLWGFFFFGGGVSFDCSRWHRNMKTHFHTDPLGILIKFHNHFGGSEAAKAIGK